MGGLRDTGIEVMDLDQDPRFIRRTARVRNRREELRALKNACVALLNRPDTVLEDLAEAARSLCGADSSVLSLEQPDAREEAWWLWKAATGRFAHLKNRALPRFPSGCAVCLKRNRPQSLRIHAPYFELMQVHAPEATDGILVPWQMGGQRGGLFVLAHGRREAFDRGDLETLELLVRFAAAAGAQHQEQRRVYGAAMGAALAAMADELAHQIDRIVEEQQHAGEGADAAEQEASLVQHLKERLRRLAELAVQGEMQTPDADTPSRDDP